MEIPHPRSWLALMMVVLCGSAGLSRADSVWNTTTGDWQDVANWVDGPPDASVNAIINNDGTATLGVGQTGSYANLTLGSEEFGIGTVEITGGALDGTDTYIGAVAGASGTGSLIAGSWSTTGSTYVGNDGGTGYLSITGGDFTTDHLYIGGDEWSRSGNGTLVVEGGRLTTRGYSFIGDSGGTGTGTVSGGVWSTGADLSVGGDPWGNIGTGTLNINGGEVTVAGQFYLGEGTDSNGTLTISGDGSFSVTSYVHIGANNGTATATITGGEWHASDIMEIGSSDGTGTVELSDGLITSGGDVVIGSDGGTGTATITGGKWTLDYSMAVGGDFFGSAGTGTLDLSAGEISLSGDLFVGRNAESEGTLRLSGTGDLSVTSNTTIGYNGGTGLAEVSGGEWSNTGYLTIGGGAGSEGTLKMSGGSISSGSDVVIGIDGGTGMATVTGGTWTLDYSMAVGGDFFDSTGTGTLEISAGEVNVGSSLSVGNNTGGDGTLRLSGTGDLSVTGDTTIGTDGATGLAEVSGGEWKTTGYLTIGSGAGSEGTLKLSGGTITSEADVVIGVGGGVGTATVSGGKWTMDYEVSVGGNKFGSAGTGTLNISGGEVSVETLTVGLNLGGDGTLKLGGTGKLTVTGDTMIGFADGAGLAQVSSGEWNNTGYFCVGGYPFADAALGTLELSGGSISVGSDAFIGTSGGIGIATVTGGSWTMDYDLNLGGDKFDNTGTGTLSISYGLVSVAGTVYAGFGGGAATINLTRTLEDIGVLAASQIIGGTGSHTINWNGGKLRALADQSDFLSGFNEDDVTIGASGAYFDSNSHVVGIGTTLKGSGSLIKLGAGSLTLSAANAYTGGTVVSEGKLLISDVGASASVLGTGTVEVQFGATLGGSGTVLGNTSIAGELAPGNSPGAIHFAGDLTIENTGTVSIEVASLYDFDRIAVDGTTTLDGILSITMLDGYVPDLNDTFAIFDFNGAVLGAFDSIVFNNGDYQGTLDYATGVLTVTAVPEPGAVGLLLAGLVGICLLQRRLGGIKA